MRQPPGVCIMLVMYNRYHNYAATQLKRINENGKFSIPAKFQKPVLLAIADSSDCIPADQRDNQFAQAVEQYEAAWNKWCKQGRKPMDQDDDDYSNAEKRMEGVLTQRGKAAKMKEFRTAHEAAWNKLDNDLFNTARL